MALEDLTGNKYIDSLDSANPVSGDSRTQGDDHIRGIKNVLKKTFANVNSAVTASDGELNYLTGATAGTVLTDGDSVDAATLGGKAESAFAELAGGNTFTSNQTILNNSATFILQDNVSPALGFYAFRDELGQTRGWTTYQEDDSTPGNSFTYMGVFDTGAALRAYCPAYEDGRISLINVVNNSSIAISAAGAITLTAATNQDVTIAVSGAGEAKVGSAEISVDGHSHAASGKYVMTHVAELGGTVGEVVRYVIPITGTLQSARFAKEIGSGTAAYAISDDGVNFLTDTSVSADQASVTGIARAFTAGDILGIDFYNASAGEYMTVTFEFDY